ncbi:hypothetical protein [Pseudomonas chlororaphis]|uniref:hypothetical protein n=1 Tax=Pseudomonas chlororaphis TaxID=587753 RepID=UPI000F574CF6|nr:hypothetical protein [Pseudomonas chlororaphis]AZD79035.1 hypothetical protein C4K15_2468 [Pseudomonas chlororaphis subsp. aurantiaca]
MQYFDVQTIHDTVPKWVAAALGLGYRWRQSGISARRIGLLSMPLESEAAGLIALGALRRDLERTTANHVDTYFDFLLQACGKRMALNMLREDSSGDFLWDVRNAVDDTRWRFVAYDDDLTAIVLEDATHRSVIKCKGKSIPNPNGACRCYIMRDNAIDWQLRDCPLPQISLDGKTLDPSAYIDLPGCVGSILEANLCRSYDGLVLVGQGAARESAYMQKFYAAGFRRVDHLLPLGDLLTLHHNEQKYIRRLRFFNERALQSETIPPACLIVADGISALLCADKQFPDSDIIGVCNRDAPVEAILQLKGWLNNIARYYIDADTSYCLVGEAPAGMLLRVLQRRQ